MDISLIAPIIHIEEFARHLKNIGDVDITINGSGGSFGVNGAILKARSDVFRKMLSAWTKENKSKVIDMPSYSIDSLRIFFDYVMFIKLPPLNMNIQTTVDILELADAYEFALLGTWINENYARTYSGAIEILKRCKVAHTFNYALDVVVSNIIGKVERGYSNTKVIRNIDHCVTLDEIPMPLRSEILGAILKHVYSITDASKEKIRPY